MASDVKWIKITTDIFDDEKILMIESMPSADSIIVIWLKLLTFAGKQNNDGVFLMSNRIAYTDEMLACIFRRDVNLIRMALKTFEQFGMIEIVEKVITIPNWNKHQSLDAYEKKKERDRLYQAERRAKQKLLVAGNSMPEGGLPLKDWQKVLKEFNNQCAYCGSTDDLEQEHIVPVVRGGRYEIGNIVPACRHCNASKKDKDFEKWYLESGVFDIGRFQHIKEYIKSSDTSSDASSYVVVSEEDKEKDIDREIDKKSVRETTHTLLKRLLPDYIIPEALAEKMGEWITYKMERKEPYKEQGMKSLLRQIENNQLQYGEKAVCDLIDESMANGWKGIIFDRLKQKPIVQRQNRQSGYNDSIRNRVTDVDNW